MICNECMLCTWQQGAHCCWLLRFGWVTCSGLGTLPLQQQGLVTLRAICLQGLISCTEAYRLCYKCSHPHSNCVQPLHHAVCVLSVMHNSVMPQHSVV